MGGVSGHLSGGLADTRSCFRRELPSSSMGSADAVELLKDAGFSGYEAKAYTALLSSGGPLNGYEIAKQSGVPRSTVYETLGKLVARGAAFEVEGDHQGVLYLALPWDSLVRRLREERDRTLEGLEEVLPLLGGGASARMVHRVAGHDDVVARSLDVIASSSRSLWLSIWPQQAPELGPAVSAAADRGVEVFVIAYGDVGDLPGSVHQHRFSPPEVVEARLRCRISIAVADHAQAVIAGSTANDDWGIWSDDPIVALLAAEHVRHDIALNIAAGELARSGFDSFWSQNPHLEALRDASADGVRSSALGAVDLSGS